MKFSHYLKPQIDTENLLSMCSKSAKMKPVLLDPRIVWTTFLPYLS